MSLIQRIRKKKGEEGIAGVLSEAPRFCYRHFIRDKLIKQLYRDRIRPNFNIDKPAVHNSVEIPPEVGEPRGSIDRWLPISLVTTDDPNAEGGEVACHQSLTKKGDTVIIIAAGSGVTTVNAARRCGPDGSVQAYEASESQINMANKVLEANDITNADIVSGIVGEDIDISGELRDDVEEIPASELPNCDVLELDCEGAEVSILKGLTQRPRVLIVEVHPRKNAQSLQLPEIVRNMGYEIVEWRSNDGRELTEDKFERELKKNINSSAGAPVLGAVLKSKMDQ